MLAGLAGCGLLAGCYPGGEGPAVADQTFVEQVVDTNNSGDCKALGDLDGDGRLDLVVGGSQLVWYHNPDWQKTVIGDAQVEFTTDCQVADVDGDGRPDAVVLDGFRADNVLWFRNPGPGGGSWAPHVIGSHGDWSHDVEVGDLDGDGKLDVVTRSPGITNVWLQRATPDSWTGSQISSRDGVGLALGDLNGDGRLDVVTGGYWLENTGWFWVEHAITGQDSASVTVADLNHDGRNDVIIGPIHASGEVAWYDGGDGRARHLVTPDSGCDYHTFKTADMNLDGNLDLVTGCQFGKISVWMNGDRSGVSWREVVVSPDEGIHNLRVGDLDGDGRPDIFGSNYIGNPPVRVWFNRARSRVMGATP